MTTKSDIDQRLEKLKAEVKKPSYVWEVVQIAEEFVAEMRTLEGILEEKPLEEVKWNITASGRMHK